MGEQVASRILDYFAVEPPTAAQQGVPAYSTPVFVPAHPRYPEGGGKPDIAVELLRHAAGAAVPVAFSTLDKLVEALGPAQPWISVSIGSFAEAMRDAKLAKVRLDPAIPSGTVHWRPEDLETYARGAAQWQI
ncbi:SAV_915 family protein [Streptomyces sp. NPDC050610]|uniref:SAV_915 family protein n=1 Tax=Streptomyces sp. NPDC050610 TaxID=3157097 RepID=UPI00341E4804